MAQGKPLDGSKNPGGRPKCKIDYDAVLGMAKIQCTQEEIAAVLGIHVSTLLRDKKFCETYKIGIEHGKKCLRRLQWDKAETGDTAALIWLGKQYLKQRDKHDLDVDASVAVTFSDDIEGDEDGEETKE
jgi:hypothetical protein